MNKFNLRVYLGLFFFPISQIGKFANYFKLLHLISYLLAGALYGTYVLQILDAQSKLSDEFPASSTFMVGVVLGNALITDFISTFIWHELKKAGDVPLCILRLP